MKFIAALFIPLLAAPAFSSGISREDLKKALQENPDVLMEALRQQKKPLFEIVSEAAKEEQERRQKEDAEREKKEFEESFKNPMAPAIDDNTRIRGNKSAKYTLVEYSDFQCPYCSRGFETVEALRKKYGNDLRFIYKHLPLEFHAQAKPAALFVEAAALQSAEKAWKAHDTFFKNQAKLGDELYASTAKELGLDMERLKKDVKSPAVMSKVEADAEEARKFGFSGTPGFLINGVPVRGAYPVDYFDQIIKRLDEKK